MKKNVQQKGNSFSVVLMQIIAIALAAVGLIVYIATGKNIFTPDLSTALIASIIAFMVAQGLVILMFLVLKGEKCKPIAQLCQFFVAIVGMLSLALFITNNVNYLASVIVAIDGTPITMEFVGTTALLFGAFLMALISANAAVSAKVGGKSDEK